MKYIGRLEKRIDAETQDETIFIEFKLRNSGTYMHPFPGKLLAEILEFYMENDLNVLALMERDIKNMQDKAELIKKMIADVTFYKSKETK